MKNNSAWCINNVNDKLPVPITLGELMEILEDIKKDMGDKVPIVMSADEEGNRYGELIIVSVSRLSMNQKRRGSHFHHVDIDYEAGDDSQPNAVILIPAI